MIFTFWSEFGLQSGQKIVPSIEMSTRNLGAALVPLFTLEFLLQNQEN